VTRKGEYMYIDVYASMKQQEQSLFVINGQDQTMPVWPLAKFPNGRELFYRIVTWIENGELPGEQTDWGEWRAEVSKYRLQEIITEYYKDSDLITEPYTGCSLHLKEEYRALQRFVARLPDDKSCYLIARES